jgi:hypothetical protein
LAWAFRGVRNTASTGKSIAKVAEIVARHWPNTRIIKAVVYATTSGSAACDLVGKIYERPHFLK